MKLLQECRKNFLCWMACWLLAGFLSQKVLAEDWPAFRGDPLATGIARSSLPDELELLWKYRPEKSQFEATPLVIDGVGYLADLDGALHAFQVSDGKALWKKETGAFSFAASLAYRDKRFYVGDIDGVFYCFDLEGELQWKFEPEGGGYEISAAATFYEGNVLYGSQDNCLYCLDAKTGKQIWKLETPDQIRCSPTVVADRCFVAGCDGQLHVIDLKQGKEAALVPIGAPTGVTPAILGEHLFVGTESGELFKIRWKDASIAWQFKEDRPREIRSGAAVTEKMTVFGSRSKNVYGIDTSSGKEVWKFRCRRGIEASPVIAGTNVVVAASDGRIHLLDVMTGKEVWKKETGDSFAGGPAVVDGKLLLASYDGIVYCFGKPK